MAEIACIFYKEEKGKVRHQTLNISNALPKVWSVLETCSISLYIYSLTCTCVCTSCVLSAFVKRLLYCIVLLSLPVKEYWKSAN